MEVIAILIGSMLGMLLVIDKFPQWLNLTEAKEVVAGTAIESSTNTPSTPETATIMEILGVEHSLLGGDIIGILTSKSVNIRGSISGKSSGATPAIVEIDDPDCLSVETITVAQTAFEATETGAAGSAARRTIFTDYAAGGKGFLYAGKTIYSQVDGSVSASVVTHKCRVLYRLVKVTATELVGLLAQ